jgi:hypothetical protein
VDKTAIFTIKSGGASNNQRDLTVSPFQIIAVTTAHCNGLVFIQPSAPIAPPPAVLRHPHIRAMKFYKEELPVVQH